MGSACATQRSTQHVEEPQSFGSDLKKSKAHRQSPSQQQPYETESVDMKEPAGASCTSVAVTPLVENGDEANGIKVTMQPGQSFAAIGMQQNSSTVVCGDSITHSSKQIKNPSPPMTRKNSENVTSQTNPAKTKSLNSKYIIHDEQIKREWGQFLNGNTSRKINNDQEVFSEISFEPLESTVEPIAVPDDVNYSQIVKIFIKGYLNPIASILQVEKEVDGSTDTTYVFQNLQILKEVEKDKRLFAVLSDTLPSSVSKQFSNLKNIVTSLSVNTTAEFEALIEKTETCLEQIENGEELVNFEGSTYMWTNLGVPLLHFAVSQNNFSAVDILLMGGAQVGQRDIHGRTALYYVKSVDMFKKLSEFISNEDLQKASFSGELVSHVLCEMYSHNKDLAKSLLHELTSFTTDSSTKEILFWKLDCHDNTAISILQRGIYTKAKRMSKHDQFKFLNEELRWQIERGVTNFKTLNSNISSETKISLLSNALLEENIELAYYLLENIHIDLDISSLVSCIKSVHVAKMVFQFYPEAFYRKQNTERQELSDLSRIILNMRSGNIPLISFLIEKLEYNLISMEIKLLIELTVQGACVELFELIKKAIQFSSCSELIGPSFGYTMSPFEYTLSLNRAFCHVTEIEQMIWTKVKHDQNETNTILLKNSCGHLLSQCLNARKFDTFKDILSHLLMNGLCAENMRFSLVTESKSIRLNLRQIDLIYNSLASLIRTSDDLTQDLTDEFLQLASKLSSIDDTDPPILSILLCLFMKKADMGVTLNILSHNYSYLVTTFDGQVPLITAENKEQVLNWISNIRDESCLRNYLVKPYSTNDKVSWNSQFCLDLPKLRSFVIQGLLADDYSFVEKVSYEAQSLLDQMYEMISLLASESSDLVKEQFKTIALKQLQTIEHFDPPIDIVSQLMVQMTKDCLGAAPNYSVLDNVRSEQEMYDCLVAYLKYSKLLPSLPISKLSHHLHQVEITSRIVKFLFTHDYFKEITEALIHAMPFEEKLKCTSFFFSINSFNGDKMGHVERILAIICAVGRNSDDEVLQLLVMAIKKSNAKFVKQLISQLEEAAQTFENVKDFIREPLFASLRSGCDCILPSLISSVCPLSELVGMKNDAGESLMHAVCFGGCIKTLTLIQESVHESKFASLLFDSSFQTKVEQNTEDEEDGDQIFYTAQYFAYCSGKQHSRTTMFELIREMWKKSLIPAPEYIGDWTRNIGNIPSFLMHFQNSPNKPLINTNEQQNYLYLMDTALWMQYLIDNESKFKDNDSFLRFYVYHFILRQSGGEINQDTLLYHAPRSVAPRHLWSPFFETLFRIANVENGDLTKFFIMYIRYGKRALHEDEILHALDILYSRLSSAKNHECTSSAILQILSDGFEEKDDLLMDTMFKRRSKMMKLFVKIISETNNLKDKLWTLMGSHIEESVRLVHPKIENNAAQQLISLFDLNVQPGSDVVELCQATSGDRLNHSDEMIAIRSSMGVVGRDWSLSNALKQASAYLNVDIIEYQPALSTFCEEKAYILTGTVTLHGIEQILQNIREQDIEIQKVSISVLSNMSDHSLASTIQDKTLQVQICLEKDTLLCSEWDCKAPQQH
ncbi:hypothetical protein C9374_014602 [Naegleria lovaniensis]|uniref:Uncharacterized protein n=1 Tax=Naegleria lovaniensis TaxID=51637 RepID=A0AA88KUH7_NAELO|nr:uncharacterized protein C9374_014602 [Naegleria lovaniensis]KAG2389202.1 hypothetical protein C9374_014602 [Naegleria lovaniensis]